MTEPWADSPIVDKSDDLLDRVRFVQMVAGAIDATPLGADSSVFGLVGPWGGGKSSIINLIRSSLSNWSIQSFAPWVANDTGSLQLEFLNALEAAVGGATKSKKVRGAVSKYSRWAVPLLGAIPVAGSAIGKSVEVVSDDVLAAPPWDKVFDKTTARLRQLGRRVLIVCDDIDRLDSAELLQFLKVVRLLGRFPNVHYLVAYDSETVEDLLVSQGVTGRLSSFMEKIVQYPFEIPAIGFQKRFDLAVETVIEVATTLGIRFGDTDRERVGSVASALGRGLLTPRAQFRFRNDLAAFSPLAGVGQETDFLDFAVLSFLRLNYHSVFEAIPKWRTQLAQGIRTSADQPNSERLTREDWVAKIREISRRDKIDVDIPLEMLGLLFPKMSGYGLPGEHPLALADEAYFQRYFNLGIADDDVSDQLTATAMKSLLEDRASEPEAEAYLGRKIDSPRNAVARLAIDKSRSRRASLGAPRNLRVVDFIEARIAERIGDEATWESALTPLRIWLSMEVKDAYAAGLMDLDGLLDRYSEADLIQLLLDAFYAARRQRDDAATDRILGDFAEHYLKILRTAKLGSELQFDRVRVILSLVGAKLGDDVLRGVFDAQLDSDPSLFPGLVTSLTRVEQWVGNDVREELAYDQQRWYVIVSPHLLRRLVPELPASPPLADIDVEDVGPINREKYAYSMSRELLKHLPSSQADQPAGE